MAFLLNTNFSGSTSPDFNLSESAANISNGGYLWWDNSNSKFVFNGSSNYNNYTPGISVEYLIVAGGGGGGPGSGDGGGGAGGYRSSVAGESTGGATPAESALCIQSNNAWTVTVGSGGGVFTNGVDSSISDGTCTITADGGGAGGDWGPWNVGRAGCSGGSGGGGSSGWSSSPGGGAHTPGHGCPGAPGSTWSSFSDGDYNSGGGGGAGNTGCSATPHKSGDGGDGLQSSITGTSTWYAGGGGGGNYAEQSPGYTGCGGQGGGGTGVSGGAGVSPGHNTMCSAGGVNTGGGGGAGCTGGSGIVIVRYCSPSACATGGQIATCGSYIVHTFTESGYFTPTL